MVAHTHIIYLKLYWNVRRQFCKSNYFVCISVLFPLDQSRSSGTPCHFEFCFHGGTCMMIADLNAVFCR